MDSPTTDEILRLFDYEISRQQAAHLAEAPTVARESGSESISPAQEDLLKNADEGDDD